MLGYLRAIRPTFGRIPAPALVLMNTLGLNVFIAIVGINAGPGFVAGLQQVGLSLFLWGIVATSVPLVVAVLLGHYVFKFHPAILFGVCAGVRTTTAALGMIQDAAKSKVPALGYGMPYAIGNTLLTIFGMAVVLLMSRLVSTCDRRPSSTNRRAAMDAVTLRQYETLSPFEIKNDLAKVATKTAKASQVAYLNAGRGNPNWIATEPRSAFFLLGQFAITESQRTMQLPAGLGGMPKAPGIADASTPGSRRMPTLPGADAPARCHPLGREDLRLQRGRLRARAGRLDHRRQLSGAGPHARAQRADRPRVPAVGDVRRAPAGRAPSASTRSRAAPRRCATSSSRSRRTAC